MSAMSSADFSAPVRWLVARSLVALGVVATTSVVLRWVGGAGLVLCVWLDALAGWQARRSQSPQSEFAGTLEMLADFLCFVWAPVSWLTAGGASAPTWGAAAVFVLAGAFRLARFQTEGLVRGGYRGLPVTYNGYAVPLVGLLVATVAPWPAVLWPAGLLVLAAAMISPRFVVPEF